MVELIEDLKYIADDYTETTCKGYLIPLSSNVKYNPSHLRLMADKVIPSYYEKPSRFMKTSKPGVYAYVYPDDLTHTIFLGSAFWTASDIKRSKDSKAGIILHELTHFEDYYGTTDDGGYDI